MSTIVLKSFNRLYQLLKIYTGVALLGGLIVIAWSLIRAYPHLNEIFIITGFAVGLIIFLINRILLLRRRPPAMADFILYTIIPKKYSGIVMGDLHQEYYCHLQFHCDVTTVQARPSYTTRLKLDLWYWIQVIRSIPVLIRLDLMEATSADRTAEITSEITAEIKERLRKILPFYRDHGKHLSSASFFDDLFP